MEEVRAVCRVLESVGLDTNHHELSAYNDSLKRLLELLEVEDLEFEVGLLVIMVVVGVGHCGKHYWTTESSRHLAKELLVALCRKCDVENCQSLLINETNFLTSILDYLKGILTREAWKQHPLHKQTLVWLIKQLKHPHVSPRLAILLPPTLWMLDDHSDYHRTLALSALTHIIQHVDPTELRWHGRADVLYQALKPLLYVNNSEVISSLHPCLLQLLPVLDYAPATPGIIHAQSQANDILQEKKIDEVFSILVDQLAKEPKISLQRAYTAQLKGYIQLLGIFSVRYIKPLLPCLLSQLKNSDPDDKLRRLSLLTLSVVISCTWPRIPIHKFTILTALSNLVQDVSQPGNTVTSQYIPNNSGVLDLVVKCLVVLLEACPDLKSDYHWLAENCTHSTMKLCLQQVFKGQITCTTEQATPNIE